MVGSYKIGGLVKDKYLIFKKSNAVEASMRIRCWSQPLKGPDRLFDVDLVDIDAQYFVLRIDADPHAQKALESYAVSVEEDNEQLAQDLRSWLDQVYVNKKLKEQSIKDAGDNRNRSKEETTFFVNSALAKDTLRNKSHHFIELWSSSRRLAVLERETEGSSFRGCVRTTGPVESFAVGPYKYPGGSLRVEGSYYILQDSFVRVVI